MAAGRASLFGTALAVTALSLTVPAPARAFAPAGANLGVTASGAAGRVGQVVNASYTVTNHGQTKVPAGNVVIEIQAPRNAELTDTGNCTLVSPRVERCRPSVAFYLPGQPVTTQIPLLISGSAAAIGAVRVLDANDPVATDNLARYTVTSDPAPSTGGVPIGSPAQPSHATPRATGAVATSTATDAPFTVGGAGDTGGTGAPALGSTPKPAASTGTSPILWLGAGVVLVALALLASLFVLRRRDRLEDQETPAG